MCFVMYKEIPYNGQDSVKSIRKLFCGSYEIQRYNEINRKNDNKETYYETVEASEEEINSLYLKAITDYLVEFREGYVAANKMINLDYIRRRAKTMLALAIACGVILPALAALSQSGVMLVGALAMEFFCIPTAIFASEELKTNETTNDIKKSIKKYQELEQERAIVLEKVKEYEHSVDRVKFSSVETKNVGNEKDKVPTLKRKKEE